VRASSCLPFRRQREGPIHGIPETGPSSFPDTGAAHGVRSAYRNLFLSLRNASSRSARMRLKTVPTTRSEGRVHYCPACRALAQRQAVDESFWIRRSSQAKSLRVAVYQVILQLAQTGNLPGDVSRTGHHGCQSDYQSQEKPPESETGEGVGDGGTC